MNYKQETSMTILEEKNEGWMFLYKGKKAHYFFGLSSLCKKYTFPIPCNPIEPVFTFGIYRDELCKKCLSILENKKGGVK